MEFRKLKEGNFNYEIAQDGTCRNVKSKHIMSIDWSGNNYGRYTFTINGVKKKYLVHRLVLSAWGTIPQHYINLGLTEDDLQVNHKDGNKHNNHITNLEYVTAQENIKHRDKVLQRINNTDEWNNQKYQKKSVLCIELNKVFESSYEAAHFLQENYGLTSKIETISGCIRSCCRGEHKIAYKFHWEFYNS